MVTDIQGMREAYDTAELDERRPWLRWPTLHSMMVLNTIAVRARGHVTDKDARDLASLLEVVSTGVYEERCFVVDLVGQFDADVDRVGGLLTGRDAGRDLSASASACLELWRSPHLLDLMGLPTAARERAALTLDAMADGVLSLALP